jgi:hypothetical protein
MTIVHNEFLDTLYTAAVTECIYDTEIDALEHAILVDYVTLVSELAPTVHEALMARASKNVDAIVQGNYVAKLEEQLALRHQEPSHDALT